MDATLIEQVAAMYGSPVDARRGNIHINCPFGVYHSKGIDTSQGLSVLVAPGERSVAYCFSCKSRGTLLFIFEEAARLDPRTFAPIAEFVRKHDGASLAGALARLHEGGEADVPETPATDWNVYAANCARQVPVYLIQRGIVRADIVKWRIGFDERIQRAIFPVRDEAGDVVGALRRSVHPDQEPRYIDTPGAYVWKKSVFYGEHDIDRTVSTAIINEGPMGTIFGARYFPNFLGMMGADTGIGPERVAKLQRWGITTLVLLLDNDKKGNDVVYGRYLPDGEWEPGLRDTLRRQFVVKVAKLPPDESPDDVVLKRGASALQEIVASASYLNSGGNLTGGLGSSIVTSPHRRGLPLSIYLRSRHSGDLNDGAR